MTEKINTNQVELIVSKASHLQESIDYINNAFQIWTMVDTVDEVLNSFPTFERKLKIKQPKNN